MKKEFQKFQAYLRGHDLKITRTRELIFREIFSSPDVHPNAYDIHRRLRAKRKEASLATIYRTLNLLVKSGLVSEIDLGEDHSHYEPEWSKMAHGHLICLSCGRVQEFSNKEIQGAIDQIGEEKGYTLDKFSIQVFGFCQKCKKG
jgi:Fur family ferric uptake transcriptional regulator